MSNQNPLSVEVSGAIAWMTLSRPQKANALNRALIESLLSAWDTVERDPVVQAAIFTGAGSSFCSGADLEELVSGGPEGIRALLDPLRTFLLRVELSRLAVIAAVHGAARAGGLELILACDAVVATRTASFGDAHLANGLLPAGGSSVRLPRSIGWHRAKWMILSAASISAETARDWGLVHEVVDDAHLRTSAQHVAQSMIHGDPELLKKAKALIASTPDLSVNDALEAEIVALQRHYHSDAFQTGVRRFLSRKRSAELKE